jgi:hypothetical protein
MSSASCLPSKLYERILKIPPKSHETLPISTETGWLSDPFDPEECLILSREGFVAL